jgi:hypothetical protein
VRYSIDTSALMDGWVRYYPPDVFPSVWDRLSELISDGALGAIEEVAIELKRKEDALHAWVKEREGFLHAIDDDVQQAVVEILARHEKLVDTRKNRSAADPFVIALAKVRGCTVVTGEQATRKPHRPNIPDVCGALRIPCVSLLELYRREGWSFR